MRKQTLLSVFAIITFILIYLFKPLFRAYPFLVILWLLLLVGLIVLNQYLLAWRKKHGRDIEEEEKHENIEADIISLRPREKKKDDISYRR